MVEKEETNIQDPEFNGYVCHLDKKYYASFKENRGWHAKAYKCACQCEGCLADVSTQLRIDRSRKYPNESQ